MLRDETQSVSGLMPDMEPGALREPSLPNPDSSVQTFGLPNVSMWTHRAESDHQQKAAEMVQALLRTGSGAKHAQTHELFFGSFRAAQRT